MASFTDGDGTRHVLHLRTRHVKSIKQTLDIDLEKIFKASFFDGDTAAFLLFMFGDSEKLGRVAAVIADLDPAIVDSLDAAALDSIRDGLLEALSDFCLPPSQRTKAMAEMRKHLNNDSSPSDGSSTPNGLAV